MNLTKKFIQAFEDITDIYENTGDIITEICEHLKSLSDDKVEISILDSIDKSFKNVCLNINDKTEKVNN